MAINLRATKNPELNFYNKTFISNDSDQGVKDFESWRAQNPNFQLKDGDYLQGAPILMHAMSAGNSALVKHLAKNMDKSTLSMWDFKGRTLFEYVQLEMQASNINKILECALIALDAGADINLVNAKQNSGFDELIDMLSGIDFECRAAGFMKFYLQMGAQCHGKIKNDPARQDRSKSACVRAAQEEIINWPKTRNLYLGGKDPDSPFSQIPSELLGLITQKYAS